MSEYEKTLKQIEGNGVIVHRAPDAQASPDVGQDAAAHVVMKPVTPLPFRVINDPTGKRNPFYWAIAGGNGYLDASNTGFELTSHMNPQDARYIVHAANNFPRLVEAFHDAIKWNNLSAVRDLLRELGEIK